MSNTKNTGGPAFPNTDGTTFCNDGMTLRDYFAAKAMEGIVSAAYPQDVIVPGVRACDIGMVIPSVAIHAYRLADAMLKAREQ